MAYNSINKVDINGEEYCIQSLTDGDYTVVLPTLTQDEVFAIQSKVDSELSTMQNNVKAKFNTMQDEVNSELNKKVDKISGKGLSTNDFNNEYKKKLDGIEDQANKYVHPSYTVQESGLYKITVDNQGHVSAVVKVSKDDITSLGIPGQDTTYPVATAADNGLMSSFDKSKLDNIEANANNYTLPTSTESVLGGVMIGDNISSTNGKISVANGTTSKKGVVQLSNSTDSNSQTTAATSNAVKLVHDEVKSTNDTAVAALPKAGGEMTGDINMGSHKITNLNTPVNDADAVNKSYADAIKTSNINLGVTGAQVGQVVKVKSVDNKGTPLSWESFLIDDYVVSEGTSGIWTYKKWASGKAECWCAKNIDSVTADQFENWNGWFSATIDAGQDFPFEFAEIPRLIREVNTTSGSGVGLYITPTYTNTGATKLVRPNANGVVGIRINYYACGKMKNQVI